MVTRPERPLPGSRSSQPHERGPTRAQMYEAAWLHYELGYTQTKIGKQYGKNKATISRWIAAAKEEGLVSIELHPPGIEDLEMRLVSSLGVEHARVIPGLPIRATTNPDLGLTPDDIYNLQMEELGKAAAELIGPRLEGNMGIGLAGGRGVGSFAREVVKHCAPVPLKVFSLGASSHEPFPFGATAVSSLAAHSLLRGFEDRAARKRAQGKIASVPEVKGYALRLPTSPDGAESNSALAKQYYDEALDDIHHVVAGVGDIASSYVLNNGQKEELTAQGAVGEVVYEVYGLGATPIRLKPRDAVFSFGIDRLRTLVNNGREVTLICKGKIDAIYELLACNQSQIVTGIVTDAPTATLLLERHDQGARSR